MQPAALHATTHQGMCTYSTRVEYLYPPNLCTFASCNAESPFRPDAVIPRRHGGNSHRHTKGEGCLVGGGESGARDLNHAHAPLHLSKSGCRKRSRGGGERERERRKRRSRARRPWGILDASPPALSSCRRETRAAFKGGARNWEATHREPAMRRGMISATTTHHWSVLAIGPFFSHRPIRHQPSRLAKGTDAMAMAPTLPRNGD